ncbi:MAG: HAD-IIIA family hydrolase [Spirochaetia bacterium]|nr:HAD-IIIA family hydrolase [Spirochaetia bacterium]
MTPPNLVKTAILAGGKGSRLASETGSLPKPLVEIGGRSVLEHQIGLLKRYGFRDVIFITGHLGDQIEARFGNGSRWGMNLEYFREETPLGTSGGLKECEALLSENFLLFNGDIMLDMDLERLLAFHRNAAALATLVVHPNDHPFDSDLIEVDAENRVTAFLSKPHPPDQFFRNLVNAGVGVFSKQVLSGLGKGKGDLGKDLIQPLVKGGRVFAYNTPEYLKDMGTPERLEKVRGDFSSGKVGRLNLSNKQKAIFLDRDGVLNTDQPFIHRSEDLVLLPGVLEAVKQINQSDFLSVVVTNQTVVARGLCDFGQLRRIHNKLEWQLGHAGAKLDAIYVCPHHPDKGYPGEVAALKIECECRKPKPGLLLQAARDLNIDLKASWIVGDHARDIEAGKSAGVRTLGVDAAGGPPEKLGNPDRVAADLAHAVRIVLG